MSDRIRDTPIVEREDLAALLPHTLAGTRPRVFAMGGCRIILGTEMGRWHLSISANRRDPTWDEIVTARYKLLPHVADMVMYLPALSDYVNVNPWTFHLYEIEDKKLWTP